MVGEVVDCIANYEFHEFREAVKGIFIPALAIVERTVMFIDSDYNFYAGMRIYLIERFNHQGEVGAITIIIGQMAD